MKQVVIDIPDNKYNAFINHVKSKFADIQIKEKNLKIKITFPNKELMFLLSSYNSVYLQIASINELKTGLLFYH